MIVGSEVQNLALILEVVTGDRQWQNKYNIIVLTNKKVVKTRTTR